LIIKTAFFLKAQRYKKNKCYFIKTTKIKKQVYESKLP